MGVKETSLQELSKHRFEKLRGVWSHGKWNPPQDFSGMDATIYWNEARKWSEQAFRLRNVHLPEIQLWEDENFRIETEDLDYERTIQKQLDRLAEARAYLECTQ